MVSEIIIKFNRFYSLWVLRKKPIIQVIFKYKRTRIAVVSLIKASREEFEPSFIVKFVTNPL